MADPAPHAAQDPHETGQHAAASSEDGAMTRAERREARRRAERERPQGAWPKIKEVLLIVFYALLIAFVVKTFLLRGFYIPSASMENTLQIKDRIFVNVAGNYFSDPDRGDVIVFEDSQGWVPEGSGASNPVRDVLSFVGVMPDASENFLIKRVIGVGGDHVSCASEDAEVTVNGKELDESSYLYPGSHACGMSFDVTVPDGEYFVMGDHRDASADSRYHIEQGTEFVKNDDVVGRAFVIAWPLQHMGGIDDHEDVFADVPAASSGS